MMIEFMIGVMLMLFIVAGMMTFLSGNLVHYARNMMQLRRVQQFDTIVRTLENELRRAGYDPQNIQGMKSPPADLAKNPSALQFQDNCILYSYDRNNDKQIVNSTLSMAEMSGMRIKKDPGADNGRLQSWFATTGLPSCASDANWINLSAPTALVFDVLKLCDAATMNDKICNPIQENTALTAIGIRIRAHSAQDTRIVIQRNSSVDLPNGLIAHPL